MAKSPAAILYDSTGVNPVGVVLDGSVYRLQTETLLAPNQTISITSNLVPSDPANFISSKLLNSSSSDMVVDGSAVPVAFTFNADPTNDLILVELRIVLSARAINFVGNKFSNIAELTNGILIEVRAQSTTVQIFNIQRNEDFLELITPAGVFTNTAGINDVIAVGLNFGGNIKLDGGSGDFVKMTIRDDLVHTGFGKINYFQASQWAVKVV